MKPNNDIFTNNTFERELINDICSGICNYTSLSYFLRFLDNNYRKYGFDFNDIFRKIKQKKNEKRYSSLRTKHNDIVTVRDLIVFTILLGSIYDKFSNIKYVCTKDDNEDGISLIFSSEYIKDASCCKEIYNFGIDLITIGNKLALQISYINKEDKFNCMYTISTGYRASVLSSSKDTNELFMSISCSNKMKDNHISPGMIIYCETDLMLKQLLSELQKMGYRLADFSKEDNVGKPIDELERLQINLINNCIFILENKVFSHDDIANVEDEFIKFNDVIFD